MEDAARARERRADRLASIAPEPEPEPEPQPQPSKSKQEAIYEALSEEDKAKADEAKGRLAEENEEALMDAAYAGKTAEVRVLLAAGTDPEAANGDGTTALHDAAKYGHEEAVGALAEGGADLDKADNNGVTPLMEAARYGHSGVVRRLLELGADHTAVGTGGDWEGKTALEAAEEGGMEQAATVLREWAASHPSEEPEPKPKPVVED